MLLLIQMLIALLNIRLNLQVFKFSVIVFVCLLVKGQFYECYEFMIHVMVLHCGVLNLVSQFVGTVVGDDVVTHCVHVVGAFL